MSALHIAIEAFFVLVIVVGTVVIACDLRDSWNSFLDTFDGSAGE